MIRYALLRDIISENDLNKIEEPHIRNGLKTLLQKEEEMVWTGDNGNYILIDSKGNIFEEGDVDPEKIIEDYRRKRPNEQFFLGRIAVRGDPFVRDVHPELSKYMDNRL